MKYVLDSSAIINLILRLKDRAIPIFEESVTASLAFYEIGNFLWKKGRPGRRLHKSSKVRQSRGPGTLEGDPGPRV